MTRLAFLFLLAACAAPKATRVAGPGYEGVILAEGRWTPTRVQIHDFERRIAGYMRREAPELKKPLGDYWRQYVGVVREGRRVIRGHFLHKTTLEPEDDLAKGLILVDDGGDDFFEVEYDPKTQTFAELWIHGES